jgi:hypothetical protein
MRLLYVIKQHLRLYGYEEVEVDHVGGGQWSHPEWEGVSDGLLEAVKDCLARERTPHAAPDGSMDLGWNLPAPASKDELVKTLKDVLAHVEADDSFEGFVAYEFPIPPEGYEALFEDADFGLMARYRIGNSMGQGGLRVFSKPREPEGEGKR